MKKNIIYIPSAHIDLEEVYKDPHRIWCVRSLCMNPSITLADIHRFKEILVHHKDRWKISTISEYIRISEVIAHPEYPWDKSSLSNNQGICTDVVLMDLPNATGEWDWRSISKYISEKDVLEHLDLPWYRPALSSNKNISVRILASRLPNAIGVWYRRRLCMFMSVRNLLAMNDRMIYDRSAISSNPDMSLTMIGCFDKFSDNRISGEWCYSSLAIVVPLRDVIANSHIPWRRECLSLNINIKLKDMLALDLPNATGRWVYRAERMVDVYSNMDIPWKYSQVAKVKDVTLRDLDFFYRRSQPSCYIDRCSFTDIIFI